jgi:hypothetical protein
MLLQAWHLKSLMATLERAVGAELVRAALRALAPNADPGGRFREPQAPTFRPPFAGPAPPMCPKAVRKKQREIAVNKA